MTNFNAVPVAGTPCTIHVGEDDYPAVVIRATPITAEVRTVAVIGARRTADGLTVVGDGDVSRPVGPHEVFRWDGLRYSRSQAALTVGIARSRYTYMPGDPALQGV